MQIEPITSPAGEPAPTGVSRRAVLRGAAVASVAGVAGATMAACGGDDDTAPAGGEAIKTADIPVGGGKVVDSAGQKVVITQPSEGEFKGFSAICTHQSCQVNEVSNNVISCPCHGSKFSAADGSVQGGPAPRPLPGVNISVSGTDITVG